MKHERSTNKIFHTKASTMKITHVIALFLSAIFAVGCSNEAALTNSPSGAQDVNFVLSPADGETSVRLDAGVTLAFGAPVDRSVVERGFHLISEKGMVDSVCPVSVTMVHGDMTGAMTYSTTMHHLDVYHSIPGTFGWNTNGDGCTFRPDSAMTPRTQYIIRLDREMTRMMEQRTGNMGMMLGHGADMMSGEMMFHFFTMDTTGSGGGHNGHH